MNNYKIVYCFLNEKGFIETYDDGVERIYIEEVVETSKEQAIKNFKKQNKNIEILEVL